MSRSWALSAYLVLSRLAVPIAPLILKRRMRGGKEDPDRMFERLGISELSRPEGPLIWLHGASVGEAMAVLPLIEALGRHTQAEFLITTGTVTSARRLAGILPPRTRHQYVPVDTAAAVDGFLNHWRPNLAIWVESELWPRLITETARRNVPMALVNARLSEASARSWAKAPVMVRELLRCFAVIRTQDHETVDRFQDLDSPAQFGGNLKALAEPTPCEASDLSKITAAIGARPVWLAASTHEAEESIVAAAQRDVARMLPGALCLIAPRHPERGETLARDLAAQGFNVARRALSEMPDASTDIWLLDTLGEMGLWYLTAPVTFVGGSLVSRGGHTPFEPIAVGSAVIHGPHVENFSPAYKALASASGVRAIREAADLSLVVTELLVEPQARAAMVQRAHEEHELLRPDIEELARVLINLPRPPL